MIPNNLLDFVYPLGHGSLFHDVELYYSTLLAKKFVSNLGRIIIIGDEPRKTLDVDYHFIRFQEESSQKQFNTTIKLSTVLDNPSISDPFVWMNDDFFFTRPTSIHPLVTFYQGSLASHIAHRANNKNKYYHSLHETYTQLKNKGFSQRDFEIHCPLVVHKPLMKKTLETFEWTDTASPLPRSLYGNQHGLNATFITDLKFYNPVTRTEILRQLGDREVFSIGDGALQKPSEMPDFLKSLAAKPVN